MWGVTLRTNVYSNLIKHEYQANTYFPLTSFLAESEQICKGDFRLPFHIFTFIFSSRNSAAILMCFPTLSCSPREDSPQDRLPTRPMMLVSWTLINVSERPVTPTRWYHGPSVSWAIGLVGHRSYMHSVSWNGGLVGCLDAKFSRRIRYIICVPRNMHFIKKKKRNILSLYIVALNNIYFSCHK